MEESLDQPVNNAVSEKDDMPYLIVEEPLKVTGRIRPRVPQPVVQRAVLN